MKISIFQGSNRFLPRYFSTHAQLPFSIRTFLVQFGKHSFSRFFHGQYIQQDTWGGWRVGIFTSTRCTKETNRETKRDNRETRTERKTPSVSPATFHREEEENGAMPAPNSQLDKDGITKIDRWLLGK